MTQTVEHVGFDPDPHGVLKPRPRTSREPLPVGCVLCFLPEVVDALREQEGVRACAEIRSLGRTHPVYVVQRQGARWAVVMPGMGAPLAAFVLEGVIALGCRRFVAVGGAGALDASLAPGALVLATGAVRDEGTSHHYAPPDAELGPSPRLARRIVQEARSRSASLHHGKTWTTDAPYRETRGKVAGLRRRGCLVVEMEAAALFAVAAFRDVELACLLYAGDDVSGEVWRGRGWTGSAARELVYQIGAAAVRDSGAEVG